MSASMDKNITWQCYLPAPIPPCCAYLNLVWGSTTSELMSGPEGSNIIIPEQPKKRQAIDILDILKNFRTATNPNINLLMADRVPLRITCNTHKQKVGCINK